jgi:hypothetical protein
LAVGIFLFLLQVDSSQAMLAGQTKGKSPRQKQSCNPHECMMQWQIVNFALNANKTQLQSRLQVSAALFDVEPMGISKGVSGKRE